MIVSKYSLFTACMAMFIWLVVKLLWLVSLVDFRTVIDVSGVPNWDAPV